MFTTGRSISQSSLLVVLDQDSFFVVSPAPITRTIWPARGIDESSLRAIGVIPETGESKNKRAMSLTAVLSSNSGCTKTLETPLV